MIGNVPGTLALFMDLLSSIFTSVCPSTLSVCSCPFPVFASLRPISALLLHASYTRSPYPLPHSRWLSKAYFPNDFFSEGGIKYYQKWPLTFIKLLQDRTSCSEQIKSRIIYYEYEVKVLAHVRINLLLPGVSVILSRLTTALGLHLFSWYNLILPFTLKSTLV